MSSHPRTGYTRLGTAGAVLSRVAELAPCTVILDIEPLVADWNSGPRELSRGVSWWADELSRLDSVKVIGFVTNSRRTLPANPARGRRRSQVRAFYVRSGGKPLRAGSYRDLPRPGAVIGDQIATDGLLAWRLGYHFLHYDPPAPKPVGTRLMNLLGAPLRPLLFRY